MHWVTASFSFSFFLFSSLACWRVRTCSHFHHAASLHLPEELTFDLLPFTSEPFSTCGDESDSRVVVPAFLKNVFIFILGRHGDKETLRHTKGARSEVVEWKRGFMPSRQDHSTHTHTHTHTHTQKDETDVALVWWNGETKMSADQDGCSRDAAWKWQH